MATTSASYVPPPPQAKSPRTPAPFVPRVAAPDVPQESGGRAPFVPPPAKRAEGKRPMPPVTRAQDVPMPDMPKANAVTPFVPPPAKRAEKPSATPPAALSRKEPEQTPALPPVVMALPGLSMAPNPFAPYCGDGRISPDSEFCREARGQGVSDFCQRELLGFLALPEPKMPLAQWIATRELCDQDALRRAANIVIAKASAGLYRASGALPNYHRAPYGFRPSGDVATAADWTHGGPADLGSGGYIATASDWGTNPNALVDPGHGSGAYNGASSWTLGGPATDIVPPAPATPPVDYAALVAGIGTGLGATLGGVSSIFRSANDARLRELELQYGADARAGQLALQRATMETNAEIQRLAAQGTPAANQAVQALQMQIADMRGRITTPPADEGMSDTTKVFLGLGAAAVLAGGFWLATRKDRR